MPLEALRHDVTPAGLHYLLAHFDIPAADEGRWSLKICGWVAQPFSLGVEDLKALPARTRRVTLECAGNGRGQLSPRYPSVPWLEEGVSTAEWTGVPLPLLLERARLRAGVKDIAFHGADSGFDAGVEHHFARSLAPDEALRDEVLVCYAMNGAPLPPQHGAPLREREVAALDRGARAAFRRPAAGAQLPFPQRRRRERRALPPDARQFAARAAGNSRLLYPKPRRPARRSAHCRPRLVRGRRDRQSAARCEW